MNERGGDAVQLGRWWMVRWKVTTIDSLPPGLYLLLARPTS